MVSDRELRYIDLMFLVHLNEIDTKVKSLCHSKF